MAKRGWACAHPQFEKPEHKTREIQRAQRKKKDYEEKLDREKKDGKREREEEKKRERENERQRLREKEMNKRATWIQKVSKSVSKQVVKVKEVKST